MTTSVSALRSAPLRAPMRARFSCKEQGFSLKFPPTKNLRGIVVVGDVDVVEEDERGGKERLGMLILTSDRLERVVANEACSALTGSELTPQSSLLHVRRPWNSFTAVRQAQFLFFIDGFVVYRRCIVTVIKV